MFTRLRTKVFSGLVDLSQARQTCESLQYVVLPRWAGVEEFVVESFQAVSRGPLPSTQVRVWSFVILGQVCSSPREAPH